MWPRGTSNSCENGTLPRAALPPVSCLNSWSYQTWEPSLILLPPLIPHISPQSLKTININSTLPPGLLTLPSSGCHSSPAPLQQLDHPSLAPSFLLFRSILHTALGKGISLKQKSTTYRHLMSCWIPVSGMPFWPTFAFSSLFTTQFRHRLLQEAFADHHSISFHFASSQSIWGPSSLLPK